MMLRRFRVMCWEFLYFILKVLDIGFILELESVELSTFAHFLQVLLMVILALLLITVKLPFEPIHHPLLCFLYWVILGIWRYWTVHSATWCCQIFLDWWFRWSSLVANSDINPNNFVLKVLLLLRILVLEDSLLHNLNYLISSANLLIILFTHFISLTI